MLPPRSPRPIDSLPSNLRRYIVSKKPPASCATFDHLTANYLIVPYNRKRYALCRESRSSPSQAGQFRTYPFGRAIAPPNLANFAAMKILFICTAFNSLAQRTALVLRAKGHAVTVEYALSADLMIEAAELARPDLIICPFLTKHVPPKVYNNWMTLIVHPGPPGDAGPSAIDWCLIGDMGELEDADQQLSLIDAKHSAKAASSTMRSHWGVTVLQAIEAFDAGPVWAFDQFELGAGNASMSKSDLYRGPVTRAALNAVVAAVDRITHCARRVAEQAGSTSFLPIDASIVAPAQYRTQCVSQGVPFLGGRTHDRPLLRASQRDFYALLSQGGVASSKPRLSADAILQRIRSADSQPGLLSSLFGTPLFLYNAHVQRDPLPPAVAARRMALDQPGTVLATREGAVLVDVGADFPIWIGHLRRPKAKADKYLHPKLPAVMALLSMPETASKLSLLDATKVPEWSATAGFGCDVSQPWKHRPGTYQQVWVDVESSPKSGSLVAFIHADFYNGAFSTTQCEILLEAIQWTLKVPNLKAVVMLGGAGYFSNGIALNVIEGSDDPSAEGWANINAIDDCVQALLAPKGIVTFAAMRGNAAAGGLAMATAADFVICAESAVLNPHYRGLGLFGSEWHTYSWYERCGVRVAAKFAREMLPMSSHEAKQIGLVDVVLENDGMSAGDMLGSIKQLVNQVMDATVCEAASMTKGILVSGAPWTRSLRPASADAVQSSPLSEQILRNKTRYLAYLFADHARSSEDHGEVLTMEEHFQRYRKYELDQMTLDFFHPRRNQRFVSRCTGFVRKLVPGSTPMRFALHRRFVGADWSKTVDGPVPSDRLDEEERDEFDHLAGIPASDAIARLPSARPEYVVHKIAPPRTTRAYSVGQDTLVSALGVDSQRTSTSTAPTTPREELAKPILSIGDEEAQRVEIEAGQLKVERVATGAGLLGDGAAVKRGPTAISFVAAEKKDAVADAKKRTGVKVRAETVSPDANPPRVAASRNTAATAPVKEVVESSKKNKIQRFFISLGRKNRSVVPSVSAGPISAPSKPAVTLAAAFHPTQPSATLPLSANATPTIDPATRHRRRSSISDVFSILQSSPHTSTTSSSPTSKSERRRSWRPTSSSGTSTFDTTSGGFQPNVTATPKIVEEASFVSTGEKNGSTPEEAVEANCLWSCYYSEDGMKRGVDGVVQPVVRAA
ncbi:Protein-S-isoprenylcysteine O-methyltransferase [Pseudozyma hubeiensis]|nr:Protein-S-isoprenylcysteine O-methyltransferase [Pseudozyma hubeiensis]